MTHSGEELYMAACAALDEPGPALRRFVACNRLAFIAAATRYLATPEEVAAQWARGGKIDPRTPDGFAALMVIYFMG